MPPCGYAMMWMSAWVYAMMRMSHWCMPWCKCFLRVCNECKCLFGSMPWRKCPFVGIPWHECFGANTIYSKIPFIFKTRLPQHLKPKYFQTWFIIHEKSSSFWLKAPKKKLVITVRKSPNGAFTWNLMIRLKRLISTIWLSKEMAHFQGLFFWKNEFFENKAF